MNVLMVTSSYPKFPGDVTAPFVESIARGVAERGHAVDVLLPHHPDLHRPGAEPVRFFPYRYAPREDWSVWGYAQSLRADVRVRAGVWLLAPIVAGALRAAVSSRLRERRYDVVHAHWVVPNAALIVDIVRAHRVPLVVSLHGSDVFLAERLAPARALARRALREAGAVTACSDDLRDRGVRLGALPERTRTVPYGVDTTAFSPSRGGAGPPTRFGARDGATLVVAMGRLVEKKGFATLVEAASRAPGIHVVIIGDGDLRADLERRARDLGAPVTFTGALERPEAARALAAADVMAVPSVVDRAGNVDGLPNAMLEGLASGRAVVASRVAGIPDVVEDGVNGLLVPPGDADALAAALRTLAADPETRERVGREARRRAEDRLSWSSAARAFEEGYAQAAALDAR
jgi:glycosyltransferase involved in cell wall biosynthesis